MDTSVSHMTITSQTLDLLVLKGHHPISSVEGGPPAPCILGGNCRDKLDLSLPELINAAKSGINNRSKNDMHQTMHGLLLGVDTKKALADEAIGFPFSDGITGHDCTNLFPQMVSRKTAVRACQITRKCINIITHNTTDTTPPQYHGDSDGEENDDIIHQILDDYINSCNELVKNVSGMDADELVRLIQNVEWSDACGPLWGSSQHRSASVESFITEHKGDAVILKRFFFNNFARVTKVVLLLYNGLHRAYIRHCIEHQNFPCDIDSELKEELRRFNESNSAPCVTIIREHFLRPTKVVVEKLRAASVLMTENAQRPFTDLERITALIFSMRNKMEAKKLLQQFQYQSDLLNPVLAFISNKTHYLSWKMKYFYNQHRDGIMASRLETATRAVTDKNYAAVGIVVSKDIFLSFFFALLKEAGVCPDEELHNKFKAWFHKSEGKDSNTSLSYVFDKMHQLWMIHIMSVMVQSIEAMPQVMQDAVLSSCSLRNQGKAQASIEDIVHSVFSNKGEWKDWVPGQAVPMSAIGGAFNPESQHIKTLIRRVIETCFGPRSNLVGINTRDGDQAKFTLKYFHTTLLYVLPLALWSFLDKEMMVCIKTMLSPMLTEFPQREKGNDGNANTELINGALNATYSAVLGELLTNVCLLSKIYKEICRRFPLDGLIVDNMDNNTLLVLLLPPILRRVVKYFNSVGRDPFCIEWGCSFDDLMKASIIIFEPTKWFGNVDIMNKTNLEKMAFIYLRHCFIASVALTLSRSRRPNPQRLQQCLALKLNEISMGALLDSNSKSLVPMIQQSQQGSSPEIPMPIKLDLPWHGDGDGDGDTIIEVLHSFPSFHASNFPTDAAIDTEKASMKELTERDDFTFNNRRTRQTFASEPTTERQCEEGAGFSHDDAAADCIADSNPANADYGSERGGEDHQDQATAPPVLELVQQTENAVGQKKRKRGNTEKTRTRSWNKMKLGNLKVPHLKLLVVHLYERMGYKTNLEGIIDVPIVEPSFVHTVAQDLVKQGLLSLRENGNGLNNNSIENAVPVHASRNGDSDGDSDSDSNSDSDNSQYDCDHATGGNDDDDRNSDNDNQFINTDGEISRQIGFKGKTVEQLDHGGSNDEEDEKSQASESPAFQYLFSEETNLEDLALHIFGP